MAVRPKPGRSVLLRSFFAGTFVAVFALASLVAIFGESRRLAKRMIPASKTTSAGVSTPKTAPTPTPLTVCVVRSFREVVGAALVTALTAPKPAEPLAQPLRLGERRFTEFCRVFWHTFSCSAKRLFSLVNDRPQCWQACNVVLKIANACCPDTLAPTVSSPAFSGSAIGHSRLLSIHFHFRAWGSLQEDFDHPFHSPPPRSWIPGPVLTITAAN